MKRINLFNAFFALCLSPLFAQGQEIEMPPGAVVRITNCTITSDRFTFDELVERARQLEFGENAPNAIFFRRPIYTAQQYQENYDLQIAAYYSSVTEMVERRVASGDDSYGRLPLSCGAPIAIRTINVNPNNSDWDVTAMTTRRCSANPDSSMRGIYNRLRVATEGFSAAGNDALIQMSRPLLGGDLEPDFDFVLATVGSTIQETTERIDMFREGFRPIPRTIDTSPSFSCGRNSMWATNRIYTADQ
tara:strand:+ start:235 stop:975 length:741 start_codon:yes stop_codon:yes gene_type:complete